MQLENHVENASQNTSHSLKNEEHPRATVFTVKTKKHRAMVAWVIDGQQPVVDILWVDKRILQIACV